MGRISKLARMQLEDAREDLSAAKDGKVDGGEGDTAMDEDEKEDGKMEEDSAKETSKEGKDSKGNEYVL